MKRKGMYTWELASKKKLKTTLQLILDFNSGATWDQIISEIIRLKTEEMHKRKESKKDE